MAWISGLFIVLIIIEAFSPQPGNPKGSNNQAVAAGNLLPAVISAAMAIAGIVAISLYCVFTTESLPKWVYGARNRLLLLSRFWRVPSFEGRLKKGRR